MLSLFQQLLSAAHQQSDGKNIESATKFINNCEILYKSKKTAIKLKKPKSRSLIIIKSLSAQNRYPYLLDRKLRHEPPATLSSAQRREVRVLAQLEALILTIVDGEADLRVALVHHVPVDTVRVRSARRLHAVTTLATWEVAYCRLVDLDVIKREVRLHSPMTSTYITDSIRKKSDMPTKKSWVLFCKNGFVRYTTEQMLSMLLPPHLNSSTSFPYLDMSIRRRFSITFLILLLLHIDRFDPNLAGRRCFLNSCKSIYHKERPFVTQLDKSVT